MYQVQKCFYLLASLLTLCLTGCSDNKPQSTNSSVPLIAITQIVSHPSLDKVRDGMIAELKKEGFADGSTAKILFENAQGSPVIAAQIANQFVAQNPAVIVAIATPSAQAVSNASKNTTIPLVFADISDPVQAKLVSDLKHPDHHTTGTRNVTPFDKEFALIKQIIPNCKSVGIVLNYGETNSVELLQLATAAAKSENIEIKTAAAPTSADVHTATLSLVGKVDAILLLQDNTVASALPALLNVSNEHQIPVFSTFIEAVQNGAVAGLAFDEYAIGEQTGKMVVAILRGKNTNDMPVEDPEHVELVVNLNAASLLHLQLDPTLTKQAVHVYSAQGGAK